MLAASQPRHTLLLDFDHTLLAGNSTELFISVCRPHGLVAAIEFAIRRCVPWRFAGTTGWFRLRDYVCCLTLLLLTPWNLLIWRRVGPRLFRERVSQEVSAASLAAGAQRIVIVTFAMDWIVRAMLRNSVWRECALLATPLAASPSYFGRGKYELVRGRFGEETVASSTFITDSTDDSDLLRAAARGVLIEPQGPIHKASDRLYLPLRFTANGKYTPAYTLDQFAFVDLALAAMCIAVGPESFLVQALFAAPLMLSFYCVYEIGYFENDMVAAKTEGAPTLSPRVERFRDYPIGRAWAWALALGGLGCFLASRAGAGRGYDLALMALSWLGLLIVVRLAFFAFNRLRPRVRILAYPVLQALKYGAVFVIALPTAFGAVMAASQAVAMSIHYCVYRVWGQQKKINQEALRLALFASGATLLWSLAPDKAENLFSLALLSSWGVLRLAKPVWRRLRRRVA